MSLGLLDLITSQEDSVRNRSLDEVCAAATTDALLAECQALDEFRCLVAKTFTWLSRAAPLAAGAVRGRRGPLTGCSAHAGRAAGHQSGRGARRRGGAGGGLLRWVGGAGPVVLRGDGEERRRRWRQGRRRCCLGLLVFLCWVPAGVLPGGFLGGTRADRGSRCCSRRRTPPQGAWPSSPSPQTQSCTLACSGTPGRRSRPSAPTQSRAGRRLGGLLAAGFRGRGAGRRRRVALRCAARGAACARTRLLPRGHSSRCARARTPFTTCPSSSDRAWWLA